MNKKDAVVCRTAFSWREQDKRDVDQVTHTHTHMNVCV